LNIYKVYQFVYIRSIDIYKLVVSVLPLLRGLRTELNSPLEGWQASPDGVESFCPPFYLRQTGRGGGHKKALAFGKGVRKTGVFLCRKVEKP
jgi:hypothetical protein